MKRRICYLVTKEQLKSHQDAKVCHICGKRFLKKFTNSKNYRKVRDHCHFTGKYRGTAYSICNLIFNVPNEILLVFHNGSNYDYHFIMKELANEFERQLECLGENIERYRTFSIPIIITRNNIVWKLARGYCLCYCKTFSLVPDSTECTKFFFPK